MKLSILVVDEKVEIKIEMDKKGLETIQTFAEDLFSVLCKQQIILPEAYKEGILIEVNGFEVKYYMEENQIKYNFFWDFLTTFDRKEFFNE